MKPWCALLAMLAAAGCGDGGPASPDRPAASIGGSWSGTVALTAQSATSLNQQRFPVSATIAQAGGSISGQFASTRMSGSFAGSMSGTDMTGTLTLRGSDACVATASMRGVVDGQELRLSAPSIGVGACSWGAQLLMTLTRQ